MRKIGSSWRTAGFPWKRSFLVAASVMTVGTGCAERERLTFAPPDDGIGPVTTIDQPTGADTTIPSGSDFFVNGTIADPDGVDTVYFLITGGSQTYPPFTPDPVRPSIRFGLPVETAGRGGETLEIQIYGVDVLGNRGETSTRQIHIQ